MTTIYLIRHAEAEGNLCRRIHGHFDTNITPNGMMQIRDLEKRFVPISIDACYSSDLTRTRTTAQAIYLQKGLKLQLNSAFREVYLGDWEDLPFGYLYTNYPDSIDTFSHQPQDWLTTGSETFQQYTTRFMHAMNQAVEAHPNQTIAIISHGAVLRGVMHVLFPDVPMLHADNTAVTCLEWDDGQYHLQYLNDNSHLQSGKSLFETQSWWKKNTKGDDGTLWFAEGLMPLKGFIPAPAQMVYTACSGSNPVGYVCIKEEGDIGRVIDLALLPAYRSQSLSIQLLGQAIFVLRKLNKKELRIKLPAGNAPMEALCHKLFFEKDGQDLVMNLNVRVIPLHPQP